jgi:hypothetical protein
VSARAAYEEGRGKHAAVLASLEGRSRALATARLVVVAAALGVVGGIVWAGLGAVAWVGLGFLVLAFFGLVLAHARVHEGAERARAGLRFHDRGLARLSLDWEKLPASSERFRRPDHPFTGDLDIFGRASVMQIVDATVTRFGEERLATFLSLEGTVRWPDEVLARQEAARELSARFPFREELAIAGGVLAGERPDPAPFVAWAEERESSPSTFLRLLPAIAWAQPAIVVAVAAVGPWLGLSAQAVAGLEALALAFGIGVGARLTPMLEAVSNRESSVTRWRAMIRAIEQEDVQAAPLRRLRAALAGEGEPRSASATQELARLERIVGFTDARRNEVFRFFVGPLLMWDAHCAMALGRWRARAGARLRVWLDALAEAEALASLGAFASEHPDFAWPELSAEPTLVAAALGHPLIPAARRVSNDVRLPSSGRALVVTGSNMSGKSTLLRALGTNAVLARAGAPVCAQALRVGALRVATSMRIADSLEQGVSHFYAELRRLKRVIDWARDGAGTEPVLFLLDEILHGTNSRERIIGACAVVKELVSMGALGAVSTHDLGITALEKELPGRVENAHFEEQVQGDEMTFDYVLRPGIVQSSNALRLMRAVGIDVGDPHEGP